MKPCKLFSPMFPYTCTCSSDLYVVMVETPMGTQQCARVLRAYKSGIKAWTFSNLQHMGKTFIKKQYIRIDSLGPDL